MKGLCIGEMRYKHHIYLRANEGFLHWRNERSYSSFLPGMGNAIASEDEPPLHIVQGLSVKFKIQSLGLFFRLYCLMCASSSHCPIGRLCVVKSPDFKIKSPHECVSEQRFIYFDPF